MVIEEDAWSWPRARQTVPESGLLADFIPDYVVVEEVEEGAWSDSGGMKIVAKDIFATVIATTLVSKHHNISSLSAVYKHGSIPVTYRSVVGE
jgi:hypothetical protein